MATKYKYIRCSERDIPGGVRFDTPARLQGQIVVVEYGGHGRSEHDDGDPWKRVTDRSTRETVYYRRAEVV